MAEKKTKLDGDWNNRINKLVNKPSTKSTKKTVKKSCMRK